MLRSTRATRRSKVGAVALSLALVAAACGGDDDAGDDGGDDAAEDTADTGDDAEDTADAGDDAEDTGDDAEDTADAGDDAEATADSGDGGDDAGNGGTTVTWFVGLGTGSQEAQIPPAQELVDGFNESQSDINLEVQFVDNNTAKEALATAIAGGNPPDLIGPVGREGANAFAGEYLDMSPLIESSGIDLSQYEQAQLDNFTNPDGSVTSLPFASFPLALYYNTELFDEAGLPYPPKEFGAPYGEGTEFEGEWNDEKMAEIAAILTVDSAGNDALSPDFNKAEVDQWGYVHQWTAPPTAQGTFFGAGQLEQEDGTAKFPTQWVDEYKWYHNLIHEVGASPTAAQLDGDVLAGNAFNSGKVGMALTHLWYTCCLSNDDGFNTFWDVAAVPSHDGTITAKLHADTFRLQKDTENPEAAFEVLRWIQEDAALDFLTIYGAMPARLDLRDPYFEGLSENFPQVETWQPFLDALNYVDVPSHELATPAYVESDARIKELEPRINGEPDLDIDAAIAEIEADLDELWANAG